MRTRAVIALLLLAPTFASAEQPLPVYPGTVHTPIGRELVISGEYYRLAYFLSGDSIAQVARYFVKQWTDEGYPVTQNGDFKTEGIVSAFYTRQGLVRSVVLTQHEGKTLGFTVLKDLWVQEPLARANKLPALEGTLFSQDVVLREESGGTQSRSALLKSTISGTRELLTKNFSAAGYTLIRESQLKVEGKAHRIVEFARGKEQAVVTLAEVEPGVVAVQQTWVGSDRPDAVPNDEAIRAAKAKKEAGR